MLRSNNLEEKIRAASLLSVMERNTKTCSPDSSVESLFPIAATGNHPIPVIDEDGKLLGQVETSAILNSMIRKTEEEENSDGIS
jgi:CBS-domain-containing membrane protein